MGHTSRLKNYKISTNINSGFVQMFDASENMLPFMLGINFSCFLLSQDEIT